MHEFAIAQEILGIVENAVGSEATVLSVHMTLGPLSGISTDSLKFCFTEMAQLQGLGSPELVIHETTAKLHCHDCELEYESRDFLEGCPKCHSLNREILSGRECTVDSVDVED